MKEMKQIKKMVEITVYVADDGTEFGNEWDCMCHDEQKFYDSIHMLGKFGKKVYNYFDALVFSINSIEQIERLKYYALKYEASESVLENVTEKGVYVWDAKKKGFYKYPENF